MTDNLASPGLCRACWEDRVAPGGQCEGVLNTCGLACATFLANLDAECGLAAEPTCLETLATDAGAQVDDVAALLQCLCGCPQCDVGACMQP